MKNKLHLAFIWHMHQPLYKDRLSEKYSMPWVRLHAIKDYLDMLCILEKYPKLRQTFNLVPCLIEQIEDYCHEETTDPYLELSKTPVAKLSLLQKSMILENFFDLNPERMVYKFPRYHEIYAKRAYLLQNHHYDLMQIISEFSEQEYLDLTVWFNLAWFDYQWQQSDADLIFLINKDRNFSEAERAIVLAKQLEIIRKIIPKYKEMQDKGQIEITTTPYYHPILPILCNSDSALVSRSHLNLPESRFFAPEDAEKQILKGIKKHNDSFGSFPQGVWPSEQSVSPDILHSLAENKIKWLVSDEGILFRSIGYNPKRDHHHLLNEPQILYRPYLLEESGGKLSIIFRDINLSDAIGFVYSRMHPQEAARDLYDRILNIRHRLGDDYPYLITVALDGENCWEHYLNDGYDFLDHFYDLINNDSCLEMTTVSDYLQRFPAKDSISNLFSGSWIRSDFTTWIGDPTKNRAWDLLKNARDLLINFQEENKGNQEVIERAWEEIYIAEGSDWFWWFGEGNTSRHDDLFDLQFRLHLQNVYRLLGFEVPEVLKFPLSQFGLAVSLPQELFHEGWKSGKVFFFGNQLGTMYQSGKVFNRIYYGQTDHHFIIRLENAPLYLAETGDFFEIYLQRKNSGLPIYEKQINELSPPVVFLANFKLEIFPEHRLASICTAGKNHPWLKEKEIKNIQVHRDFIEVRIPFTDLKLNLDQEISLIILAFKNDHLLEIVSDPLKYKIV